MSTRSAAGYQHDSARSALPSLLDAQLHVEPVQFMLNHLGPPSLPSPSSTKHTSHPILLPRHWHPADPVTFQECGAA
eukprot:2737200-Rhodomonas_salina.2